MNLPGCGIMVLTFGATVVGIVGTAYALVEWWAARNL
jgi:hypothetical protein